MPAQINILKERVLDLTKHPHLLADYYPLVQMFIEGVDEKNGAIFLNAIKGAKITSKHPIIDLRDLIKHEIIRFERKHGPLKSFISP